MLFLYRLRHTWLPYRVPGDVTQQEMYNRHLQEKFDATMRVPRQAPTAPAVVRTTRPAIGLPKPCNSWVRCTHPGSSVIPSSRRRRPG
jgi:hypothetical protein